MRLYAIVLVVPCLLGAVGPKDQNLARTKCLSPSERIVGTWVGDLKIETTSLKIEATLGKDLKMTVKVTAGGESQTIHGSFQIKGTRLIIDLKDLGRGEAKFSFAAEDLVLKDDNGFELRLKRK